MNRVTLTPYGGARERERMLGTGTDRSYRANGREILLSAEGEVLQYYHDYFCSSGIQYLSPKIIQTARDLT